MPQSHVTNYDGALLDRRVDGWRPLPPLFQKLVPDPKLSSLLPPGATSSSKWSLKVVSVWEPNQTSVDPYSSDTSQRKELVA
jgi:hypothetical protein